jgi:hypothetical protein
MAKKQPGPNKKTRLPKRQPKISPPFNLAASIQPEKCLSTPSGLF